MVRIQLLGSAELRRDNGKLAHSFLAGPKRLALLSYLLLYKRNAYIRRDQILPLLWPHQGQKHARNSLSNLLYHIRKALGQEIIFTRGAEELKMNAEKIWCDALDLPMQVKNKNWAEVTRIYGGELLEGFHVPGCSPEFSQWLETERYSLRSQYLKALEQLALQAERADNFTEAVKWWEIRSQEDPYNSTVVKSWIRALAATGNETEALMRADHHAKLLEKEFGRDRDKAKSDLIQILQAGSNSSGVSPAKKSGTSRKETVPSIAVLPFEEFVDDPEMSFFAGGVHHDLLSRLSSISELRVISRTSVLRYKNNSLSIPEIADELNASFIVEGAIQQKEDHLRLHIQMIDAESDGHESADTYDRKVTTENLFDIQSELAEQIARNLKAKLTRREKERAIEWQPTQDLEAYRNYSTGKMLLARRTRKGMSSAISYFKKAVELDPDYATAWAGLADAYALSYDYRYAPYEILTRAEDAIKQALKLDENLAEAHASLGLIYSNQKEGPKALEELNKAVQLKPGYAEAHNWLSWNYQLLGQPEKALDAAKKAVELDPLSPEAVSNLSFSLLQNGMSALAGKEAERAQELAPDWSTPAFYKALALYEAGEYVAAKNILQNLEVFWAGNGPEISFLLCEIAMGEPAGARRKLELFKEKGNIFAAGFLHAAFGEVDESLRYFQKVDQWDDWPTISFYSLFDSILNPVRTHSRYNELLNQVQSDWGAS